MRLDVQGLRAVAVVAVVVNHLTGHPRGGFLGVDVFFVISGFLITGVLLREGERTGSISFLGFYKRRIRRLLPAALTVTVLTMIAAELTFAAQRAHDTIVDGLWATAFAANWRFIATGTNYFESQRAISPFQHYWSLSVEEQFYVVWPAVLFLVLLVCRKLFVGRTHAVAATGTIAAVLLTGLSLGYAWYASGGNSVVAYFSTFTRGWELGIGAILAVTIRYMRGNWLVLTVLSWTGLLMIGLSLLLVTSAHVPFPGAIPACLGSALVIVAHSPNAEAANVVLTNPVSVYLGDISYSIYLVHFPVIIFAEELVADRSITFYLAVSALILGLSMLLFDTIEDPIRQSRWLTAGPAAAKAERARNRPGYASAGALLAVLALVTFVLAGPDSNSKLIKLQQIVGSPDSTQHSSGPKPLGPQARSLTRRLRSALVASSWPRLSPSPGQVITGEGESTGCAQNESDLSACTFGDKSGSHSIYLVGDSTSLAYDDAFIDMVKSMPGWRVRLTGGSGCAFANTVLNEGAGNNFATGCPARNRAIVKEIRRVRPDVVVETSVRGDPDYMRHIGPELQKIRSATKHLVILPAPPQGADPGSCFTKVSTPSNCVTQISSEYYEWIRAERGLARRLHGTFIDSTTWYSVNQYCPMFVGHVGMRRDRVHITPQYAALIHPVLKEALTKEHVLP